MSENSDDSWEVNRRAVLRDIERLQGSVDHLMEDHVTKAEVHEISHKGNNTRMLIEGHIKVCDNRETNEIQKDQSHDRLHTELARRLDSDKAEAKLERNADLAEINQRIQAIASTVSKKTRAQDKLIQRALISFSAFVSAALMWTLGKLLHLI